MLFSPLAGRSAGAPGSSFVLVEWTDEGGTSRERPIAPLHVHHSDDESWYVLDGKLGFRVGDEEVEAGPGTRSSFPQGRRTPTGTPSRRRRATYSSSRAVSPTC